MCHLGRHHQLQQQAIETAGQDQLIQVTEDASKRYNARTYLKDHRRVVGALADPRQEDLDGCEQTFQVRRL